VRAIRLELPSGEVRPIAEERCQSIVRISEKLRAIGSGVGSVPDALRANLERRLQAFVDHRISFDDAIDDSSMARAFLVTFRARHDIREAVPFSAVVVRRLVQLLANRPAPLVAVYLEYFDRLEARRELGEHLLNHYTQAADARRLGPSDQRFRQFAWLLFAEDGPQGFADNATRAEGGVAGLSKLAGVPIVGEFHDTVWRYFYVAHANAVPLGTISQTLFEALQTGTHEKPLKGRLVGHFLVETLVARCIQENRPIPDQWLSYVLKLAGDPRKSPTSLVFQKWWAQQQAAIIRKVVASLAKRDLKFFLELLEEFSVQMGGDMERMYPARKRFLEGFLAEGDSVQDALLILSESGRRFIRQKLPPEERKEFTSSLLHGGNNLDQSAIYLELPNGHVIEGSHQSRLRFYRAEAPFPCGLRDRRPNAVEYRQITGSETAYELNHAPPVSWQFRAMEHIAQANYGLRINPEKALNTEDYRHMLERFGAI